jgi:hypothetical protein
LSTLMCKVSRRSKCSSNMVLSPPYATTQTSAAGHDL